VLILAPILGGCLPRATVGTLAPALRFVDTTGGRVPVEHGIVVPSFEVQPRPRLDLDGPWRVETAALDDDLSLTDRAESLPAIVREAAGRESVDFDDDAWPTISVPGTIDPPPRAAVGGAWYRRHLTVPLDWTDRSVTLKFEAVSYVADVWLNGTYLGSHEGGATPFAFDVGGAMRPGADNVLAVRVDVPALGTRVDTVPWGLIDWWSYGGITGSVWLEASDPVRVARADVVPHLDGADVAVAVENRTDAPVTPDIRVDVYPAVLSPATLLDPDPAALLAPLSSVPSNPRLPVEGSGSGVPVPGRTPAPPGRIAVASATLTTPAIRARSAAVVTASLLIPSPAVWDLGDPNLYVAQVTVDSPAGRSDTLLETFGLRRVSVDSSAPGVLLNGRRIALAGVAVHDEVLTEPGSGASLAAPLSAPADALAQLRRAQAVNADFVRAGHEPADPALLRLADRLGIAVWEEIPLYHFTPLTFQTARQRGVAAQLLTEMALRDMNRPSVLFHGLSNESTGGSERTDALAALRAVDRDVDGTRLTGQAAYGFDAADGTSDPLDVVGITSYFGVFYGRDAEADTAAALDAAHARYPTKPVMILEFGHWADTAADEAEQTRIFTATSAAVAPRRATVPGGFVSSLVWWSLDDYLTSRPGITTERFGLFAPDGRRRPVASVASDGFAALGRPAATAQRGPVRETPPSIPVSTPPVLGLLLLTLAVSIGGPLAVLAVLAGRGHWRSRPARHAVRRPHARTSEASRP
jgi:beta-galactosidase